MRHVGNTSDGCPEKQLVSKPTETDVSGYDAADCSNRNLIVTQQFPETPSDVNAELRQIVESIRFVP